ncbi:MAG: Panacea domain-containing protein [bacterium]|nr:Panacea domain-containing protein [bacterium]
MALGTKLQSAILHIARNSQGGVLRTQLMKLLYLADYYSYALWGATITGAQYKFDKAGPLSVAFYEATEAMEGWEISVEESVSLAGRPYYVYRPGPAPRFEPDLREGDLQVLRTILDLYRAEPWENLLEVAYGTPPMRNAQCGTVLQMKTLRERARERITAMRQNLPHRLGEQLIPTREYGELLLREAEDLFAAQSGALPT